MLRQSWLVLLLTTSSLVLAQGETGSKPAEKQPKLEGKYRVDHGKTAQAIPESTRGKWLRFTQRFRFEVSFESGGTWTAVFTFDDFTQDWQGTWAAKEDAFVVDIATIGGQPQPKQARVSWEEGAWIFEGGTDWDGVTRMVLVSASSKERPIDEAYPRLKDADKGSKVPIDVYLKWVKGLKGVPDDDRLKALKGSGLFQQEIKWTGYVERVDDTYVVVGVGPVAVEVSRTEVATTVEVGQVVEVQGKILYSERDELSLNDARLTVK